MKSLIFKTVVCSLLNVIIGLSIKIAFFFSGKELMLGFAFNSYGGNQSRMSTNQSLEQALPYVGRAVLTTIDVNLTTEGKIFKPR